MIKTIKKILYGIVLSFMGLIWNNMTGLLPKDNFGKYVFYALIVLFGMVGFYILLV